MQMCENSFFFPNTAYRYIYYGYAQHGKSMNQIKSQSCVRVRNVVFSLRNYYVWLCFVESLLDCCFHSTSSVKHTQKNSQPKTSPSHHPHRLMLTQSQIMTLWDEYVALRWDFQSFISISLKIRPLVSLFCAGRILLGVLDSRIVLDISQYQAVLSILYTYLHTVQSKESQIHIHAMRINKITADNYMQGET